MHNVCVLLKVNMSCKRRPLDIGPLLGKAIGAWCKLMVNVYILGYKHRKGQRLCKRNIYSWKLEEEKLTRSAAVFKVSSEPL